MRCQHMVHLTRVHHTFFVGVTVGIRVEARAVLPDPGEPDINITCRDCCLWHGRRLLRLAFPVGACGSTAPIGRTFGLGVVGATTMASCRHSCRSFRSLSLPYNPKEEKCSFPLPTDPPRLPKVEPIRNDFHLEEISRTPEMVDSPPSPPPTWPSRQLLEKEGYHALPPPLGLSPSSETSSSAPLDGPSTLSSLPILSCFCLFFVVKSPVCQVCFLLS
jgi:hypothetical protein